MNSLRDVDEPDFFGMASLAFRKSLATSRNGRARSFGHSSIALDFRFERQVRQHVTPSQATGKAVFRSGVGHDETRDLSVRETSHVLKRLNLPAPTGSLTRDGQS